MNKIKELVKKYKYRFLIGVAVLCMASYQPIVTYVNTINPSGGNLNVQGTLSINGVGGFDSGGYLTGNPVDQMKTNAQQVFAGNSVFASYTQGLIQNGTLSTNKSAGLAAYPYVFNYYAGSPVSFNIHNIVGPNIGESNQLIYLTNIVTSGLVQNVPRGMVYIDIDEDWPGSSYTNWDTTLFPNGFTNILKYAHANGVKVLLNNEPGTVNSAGKPGFSTNVELFAAWCASIGMDGVRSDWGSAAASSLEFKVRTLQRLATAFSSANNLSNTELPFFESQLTDGGNTQTYQMFLTNAAICSMLPPGTIFWDYGDPAAFTTGFARFTNTVAAANNDIAFLGGNGRWNMGDGDVINDMGDSAKTAYEQLYFAIHAMLNWQIQATVINSSGWDTVWVTNGVLPIYEDSIHEKARLIYNNGGTNEVWVKNLSDGSKAVLMLNETTNTTQTFGFTWPNIGVASSSQMRMFDIYQQTNTISSGSYTSAIPAMGMAFLRLYPYIQTLGTQVSQSNNVNLVSSSRLYSGLNDGLVLWYPFGEANGVQVNDFSPNAFDGGLTATSIRNANGIFGFGLLGDGSNYVTNNPAFMPSTNCPIGNMTNFTVAIWLNANTAPVQWGIAGRANGLNAGDWELTFWATNQANFYVNNQAGSRVDANYNPSTETTQLTTNVWHLFAGTFDGAHIKLWIDGAVVASASQTGYLPVTPANQVIEVGSRAGETPFKGFLDEYKMWNRALNTNEIVALYNDGFTRQLQGITTNIQFTDTALATVTTNTLYFTNGILQRVTSP